MAKKGIDEGIESALKDHKNWFYYGELLRIANSYAQPYRDMLDDLEEAAKKSDDATTRAALKKALKTLVDNKTVKISVGIPGVVAVEFNVRVLTDKQASDLTLAMGYVDNIPAKSNVMIKMRDIYNVIPSKAIFEQVRDDIKDGVLVMEEIGELGFVFPHTGQRAFNACVVIGGKRYEVGSIDALTIGALATKVTDAMITALRTN